MNAIKDDVTALVKKELAAANEKFPLFRGNHEAYAVILEEVEEAADRLESVRAVMKAVWEYVKVNSSKDVAKTAEMLRIDAEELACEAIQVAAMAQKAIHSIDAQSIRRIDTQECEYGDQLGAKERNMKENRWIPVKERLPTEEDIHQKSHNRHARLGEFIVMIEGADRPTTLYYNGYYWRDSEYVEYNVIAWMPLPSPYVEE